MSNVDFSKILEGLPEPAQQEILSRIEEITANALTAEVGKIRKEGTPAQKELRAKYIEEMTNPAIRGKGHMLKQVKEKYVKLGVDVDSVDFS